MAVYKDGDKWRVIYRYNDYQSAVARWEQQTGNRAETDSMKTRLQKKQQEVKERENNRQSYYYRRDRGGR